MAVTTSPRRDTREELLETGTRLFLEKGYSGTGLQDVLKQSGVPKGSFYHFFTSKEEFGGEVVEKYSREGLAQLEATLDQEGQGHLVRLRRFFEEAVGSMDECACRGGCLMGSLGQEVANVSEPIRERIVAEMQRWSDRVARCLRDAQAAGELCPELDATHLAELCLLSWEGALLQMRIQRSTRPLETFLGVFFDDLLIAPQGAC